MNKNLKVSIVIPCYNQGNFIEETIDSVINQTYNNWECVIVDDGSTDESLKILESKVGGDSRFKVISIKNSGVAFARNIAIKESKGTFILPLDGDDKINKKYLELAVEYFEKKPETDLLYCNAEYFGVKKGIWVLPEYSYSFLMNGNCIFCSAIYRRKDYMEKTKGYDEELKYGYEDWEFWLQLLNSSSNVVKLPQVLFYYRQHHESRNTSVLEEEKLDITLKHIYGKHFETFFEYHGGVNNDKVTSHSVKGEFIKFIKENNLILNKNNKLEESATEIFLKAENLKKIKRTISYKLFVRFELSLKKKKLKFFS